MDQNLKNQVLDKLRDRIIEKLDEVNLLSILIKDKAINIVSSGANLDFNTLRCDFKHYDQNKTIYDIQSLEWALSMRVLRQRREVILNDSNSFIHGIIKNAQLKITYDNETGLPKIEILKFELPDPIYKIQR